MSPINRMSFWAMRKGTVRSSTQHEAMQRRTVETKMDQSTSNNWCGPRCVSKKTLRSLKNR